MARPRMLLGLLGVALVGVVLLLAFVPRTVAEGGEGASAWRLTASPGIVAPILELEWADGSARSEGYGLSPSIADTRVWPVPPDAPAATVVAGPTPGGADSIRVTAAERGVGEAVVRRVLWRRIHVTVLPPDARVTELVAIDRDGQVLEVASDLDPTLDDAAAAGARR